MLRRGEAHDPHVEGLDPRKPHPSFDVPRGAEASNNREGIP